MYKRVDIIKRKIEHIEEIVNKAGRNFVAHDYEGVNMALIEGVIREYLPKLKKSI